MGKVAQPGQGMPEGFTFRSPYAWSDSRTVARDDSPLPCEQQTICDQRVTLTSCRSASRVERQDRTRSGQSRAASQLVRGRVTIAGGQSQTPAPDYGTKVQFPRPEAGGRIDSQPRFVSGDSP